MNKTASLPLDFDFINTFTSFYPFHKSNYNKRNKTIMNKKKKYLHYHKEIYVFTLSFDKKPM